MQSAYRCGMRPHSAIVEVQRFEYGEPFHSCHGFCYSIDKQLGQRQFASTSLGSRACDEIKRLDQTLSLFTGRSVRVRRLRYRLNTAAVPPLSVNLATSSYAYRPLERCSTAITAAASPPAKQPLHGFSHPWMPSLSVRLSCSACSSRALFTRAPVLLTVVVACRPSLFQ